MNKPERAASQFSLGKATIGVSLIFTGIILGVALRVLGAGETGEFALSERLLTNPNMDLVRIGEYVNTAFGVKWAPILTLVIAALVWFRSKSSAVLIAFFTMAGWLPCGAAKYLFQRPRPGLEGLPTFVDEFHADSFPSGHTAFAVALTIALMLVLSRAGKKSWPVLIAGIPVVLFSAVSAVVTGRHFVGDTIGSMILAPGFLLLVHAFMPWIDRFVPWSDAAPEKAPSRAAQA